MSAAKMGRKRKSHSATPAAAAKKEKKSNHCELKDKFKEMRASICKDITGFKFNKKRIRMITTTRDLRDDCDSVLYWMVREQRVQDNWALLYAQRLAMAKEVSLIVCFCLPSKYMDATMRQYDFMIKGLKEVEQELKELSIGFVVLKGEAPSVLPEFVKNHKVGGIVVDFLPLRLPLQWLDKVKQDIPKDIPICQVDAHNIVPCWEASNKQEYAARTIRPKITKMLTEYLTQFPSVVVHPFKAKKEMAQTVKWDAIDRYIKVDRTVTVVKWATPGTSGGLSVLNDFCSDGIKHFSDQRNDPTKAALSNLSPWLHSGQISAQRVALHVREFRSKHPESVAAFLEEMIIRRELSDNFCFYNGDKYDSIEGTSDWAKTTLATHANDKRDYLYSVKQFDDGATHDDLWNAAQRQLLTTGKMHGFLRMYWAKKILEWTESPQSALKIALYLNDRYQLDGIDPNGFVGCMWSICGVHDQGWAERAVFGKIRYMNYKGCRRKFNVDEFVRKYSRTPST